MNEKERDIQIYGQVIDYSLVTGHILLHVSQKLRFVLQADNEQLIKMNKKL